MQLCITYWIHKFVNIVALRVFGILVIHVGEGIYAFILARYMAVASTSVEIRLSVFSVLIGV